MPAKLLNAFGKQTRDIMAAYLREEGVLQDDGLSNGKSDMRAKETRRIAASLRMADEVYRACSDEKVRLLPKNATMDYILSFLHKEFGKEGEINWERIVQTVTLVGRIISKTHMGQADALSLVGTFAEIAMEELETWVTSHGGWSSVVNYINSLSVGTKVGLAAGAVALMAGVGYLLFGSSRNRNDK